MDTANNEDYGLIVDGIKYQPNGGSIRLGTLGTTYEGAAGGHAVEADSTPPRAAYWLTFNLTDASLPTPLAQAAVEVGHLAAVNA